MRLSPFALAFLLALLTFVQPSRAVEQAATGWIDTLTSEHFKLTIDGKPATIYHVAVNLYFANFEAGSYKQITVTAPTDDFWSRGVEIQPWSLGIRPKRSGRTISFMLDGPLKISISRPGDYLSDAEMLYLFANPPEHDPPLAASPTLRYFGPGVHTENIDAQAGDVIYLAPGAIVVGALNIWAVDHVKVFGRGVILYDGPQSPSSDDGWKHKKNWHCIVMDNAHDITIEGITCVVRSRTWQIQMKDSRRILFDNVKVIGANSGNANADGMDWLGGGDTVVRNSFFRAADDIFAMYTSWEGYGAVAFAVQGSPVTNVTVEDSVLSTSISNIVRMGWPRKNSEGGNFSMRNTDILHMGLGGCGVPFALMELWADPDGRGQSSDFSFKDIRMEDWYSLVQLLQPASGAVKGVHFTDVSSLGTPSLVPSVLKGKVDDVTLDNVTLSNQTASTVADLPMDVESGAKSPAITNTAGSVEIKVSQGWLHPGTPVRFDAVPHGNSSGMHYTWLFGDGTRATGRAVTHRFMDSKGTLLDGSGLYRVLLHVSTDANRNTWLTAPILITDSQMPAIEAPSTREGVSYKYTEDDSKDIGLVGTTQTLELTGLPHRAENYTLSFASNIEIPHDGGYQFTVIANDTSAVSIDGRLLGSSPAPFPQVCGLAGNAARSVVVSAELAKGRHRLEISESHHLGTDNFRVLWQAQGLSGGPIPAKYLFLPEEP